MIYDLLKIFFYNYFTSGDDFMCLWKKFNAIWSYMHIMHQGYNIWFRPQSKVRIVFYLSKVSPFSSFSSRHCTFPFHYYHTLHCIYQYSFYPLSPNSPCGWCLLFVASATLDTIDLILSQSWPIINGVLWHETGDNLRRKCSRHQSLKYVFPQWKPLVFAKPVTITHIRITYIFFDMYI